MSSSDLRTQIKTLKEQLIKQLDVERQQEIDDVVKNEEARLERLKNKTLKLNQYGKPITGEKKICSYTCGHCDASDSDESDIDFIEEYRAYKNKYK